MTENVLESQYPTPWYVSGARVYDADGIEVADAYTPDLSLSSAKAVAKGIVDAVNAHYGGKDRIADLERKLKRAHDTMADLHRDKDDAEKRAEAAEARLKDVDGDRWKLLLRAEDAADLSYYKTASKNFEDSYWEANKRAEEAEARVSELEEKLERATWKYGVLDYDRRMDLAKAGAGSAAFLDDEYDDYPVSTFTAPDGRVFRVGQRVWHIWDEPGEFGHVTDINGGFPFVQFRDANDQTHPDNLRRVWDGLEEPDVPVGTVLRDSYGCYLERLIGTRWEPRWELRDEKGDLIDNDEWINLDGEQFRPYVEVLEGGE